MTDAATESLLNPKVLDYMGERARAHAFALVFPAMHLPSGRIVADLNVFISGSLARIDDAVIKDRDAYAFVEAKTGNRDGSPVTWGEIIRRERADLEAVARHLKATLSAPPAPKPGPVAPTPGFVVKADDPYLR